MIEFMLFMSIVTSAALFLILKKFATWGVPTLHGIIFNYITASILSFLIASTDGSMQHIEFRTILPYSVTIGLLFILVFLLTGKTAQLCGMAASSVASKMSMVIPISAGFILYHETLDIQKIIGLIFALPAVLFTGSVKSGIKNDNMASRKQLILLPVLLFLGAGLVDTSIKFSQARMMDQHGMYLVMGFIFGFAGLFGITKLIMEIIKNAHKIYLRSVLAGVLLGVVNFFSLYFMIKSLATPGIQSSYVFAIVNVGVVLASFIAGLLVFREKPDKIKLTGIALAVVSIVILAF